MQTPDPLKRLEQITRTLREPGGCEWDRKQTHQTMRASLVEEAYEIIETIDHNDHPALCEELGDLLFLIYFHARLAEEAGHFTIHDVAQSIAEKLTRRHPHVFAGKTVADTDEIVRNWETIKAEERQQKAASQKSGLFDGVSASLPALLHAHKIQNRAAHVGFDWPEPADVFAKLDEEIEELQTALKEQTTTTNASIRQQNIEEEAGDILFTAVNLCRHLKVDPELALHAATNKFKHRFQNVETQAAEQKKELTDFSLAELETFWTRAKTNTGTNTGTDVR